MKRRALVFWPGLLALTASSLGWMIHVPRAPDRLFGAVPASATLLSVHRGVAQRWDGLSAHPLFHQLAVALGARAEEGGAWMRDPGLLALLDRIARDELLFAHVPRMPRTGQPAWVFAAWLGGGSQRMRWMLASRRDPDLQRAATRNGWRVWVWTPRELHGQRVTFALVEGMLVGCIAAETGGIDDLLACVDGRAPSMAAGAPFSLQVPAGALDRGWWNAPAGGRFPFDLDFAAAGGLSVAIQTPWLLPPVERGPQAAAPATAVLPGVVGDRAAMLALCDRALVRHWLGRFEDYPAARELARLADARGASPVELALLGGDYSGRFLAVRLPTALAALAGPPAEAGGGVSSALDRLNQERPWGLIAAPAGGRTGAVWAIESTGEGPYAEVPRDERIAFRASPEGLLLASNLSVLERLLRATDAGAPPAAARRMGEAVSRLASGALLGYLWMDAPEAARVIRFGVTAWSLKLLMENPAASQPLRQTLHDVVAVAGALAPLGQVVVELDEQDGRARLVLRAGE